MVCGIQEVARIIGTCGFIATLVCTLQALLDLAVGIVASQLELTARASNAPQLRNLYGILERSAITISYRSLKHESPDREAPILNPYTSNSTGCRSCRPTMGNCSSQPRGPAAQKIAAEGRFGGFQQIGGHERSKMQMVNSQKNVKDVEI